jgi:tetratricopeptide (TPR) repeat protein
MSLIKRVRGWIEGNAGTQAKQTPTPEEDIALAKQAIAQGELQHAAFHVGAALVSDPSRREWLVVLDHIAGISSDPLSLAPSGENNYAGTAAVRAYLLARLERFQEAVDLVISVAKAVPGSAFLPWAVDWIQRAPGQINCEVVVWYLGQIGHRISEMAADPVQKRGTLDHVLPLIQALCRTQSPDSMARFLFVGILRRMGHLPEMMQIASEGYALHPDHHSAAALGSALRAIGDIDQACAMFEKALEYAPGDMGILLDLADLQLELGRAAVSADLYGRALSMEPQHSWALSSYYAAQWLATGAEEWRQKLDAYEVENADNERARDLKGHVLYPVIGQTLPEPAEASINVARKVLASWQHEKHAGGSLSLKLNYLEAPSATIAVAREFARLDPSFRIDLQIEKVQRPDPRQPRTAVSYRLWTYSDKTPTPAVERPSPEIAGLVATIARCPYSRPAWSRMAADPARRPDSINVMDLLSVMIYPGETPTRMRAWDWLYRNQVAAAFMLAHLDGGWTGSMRRSVLLSLANGPMDWTVNAAVIALSWIAKRNDDAAEEVRQLYLDLIAHARHMQGYVCYLTPTVLCAIDLPNIGEAKKKELIEILERG